MVTDHCDMTIRLKKVKVSPNTKSTIIGWTTLYCQTFLYCINTLDRLFGQVTAHM